MAGKSSGALLDTDFLIDLNRGRHNPWRRRAEKLLLEFVRYLLRQHPDWEIVNLDKLTYTGNPENLADVAQNPRYRFVRGDIADRELVDRLFSTRRFEFVAKLAAESHVDRSILDPAPFLKTNVKGTQVLPGFLG